MGEKSVDSDFDTRHVMEVNTAVASSDDDLNIDLNNNSKAEKPQMTTQTVQEKHVPSQKTVIKKHVKELKTN